MYDVRETYACVYRYHCTTHAHVFSKHRCGVVLCAANSPDLETRPGKGLRGIQMQPRKQSHFTHTKAKKKLLATFAVTSTTASQTTCQNCQLNVKHFCCVAVSFRFVNYRLKKNGYPWPSGVQHHCLNTKKYKQ